MFIRHNDKASARHDQIWNARLTMHLGIDVGTQSVKALIFDPDGVGVRAVHAAPLALTSADDGTREQLAEWWITALRSAVTGLPDDLRNAVRGIGVSGQQHGFVPLGAGGEVLAPVKLWCDTATAPECDELMEAFGGAQACISELGNPILPGYTASKILWLRKHRPEAYAQLDTILLPHDYINFVLTGEKVMEAGDASGTGLLNVYTRSWHAGMLAALDPDRDLTAALPDLVPADRAIGTLRADIAAELGLPPGIPVAPGGGDNMLAAIGTGSVAAGRMTVSLGTSGTLFASADAPVVDPAGNLAAFCSSTGNWLPLVCTMNCTVATELGRGLFDVGIAALEAEINAAQPGAGGVMTLPFFNGERTPNLPGGKGCVLGLTENNYRRGNLLRSAMESAVYGLRAGLDTFRSLECPVERITLTGGGAGSASWRQMVADLFNMPVLVQANDEGAALGAALQSLWLVEGGDLPGLVDELLTLDEARCCEPAADNVDTYATHYDNYLRHVQAIAPLYSD
ncbi:MAG: xylulokinase [Halioglobus sp.]|nr:xylulokinase [Halioglobus sp.]